ncbi:DUF4148 domain-containing protein [Paraburkholderia sp. SIMBA_030]|uniref:DUF4148 domain-containing protein n=1 Tax=Paraburkholderia sp. SIMBA_030 TaxID=3085773 RepID=UPI00397D91C2
MKSLINMLIAASVLVVPVLSFAQQSTAPVTRAQVRAELSQLEAAGFKGGVYSPRIMSAFCLLASRIMSRNGQALCESPLPDS